MDDQANPEAATLVLNMLVSAVTERGLSAQPFGDTMVWVCNRAADPPADASARVWRLNPGLRQAVQLGRCEDGRAAWFWVWHSPGSMPEYEWIAPASEVDKVATKLALVLAVRSEPVS